ncbi:hypothetical protein, partial [Sutterella wadsworthensis]|uniref:hypothetical protein n=1 Tax=Sutterella wadsworthensis TaxID=40545 RepID=UPI0039766143
CGSTAKRWGARIRLVPPQLSFTGLGDNVGDCPAAQWNQPATGNGLQAQNNRGCIRLTNECSLCFDVSKERFT